MLKGKVAIITGASRGIGRSIALGLAKENCSIVIADKNTEHKPHLPYTIYSVKKEVENNGGKALAHNVDFRNNYAMEELVYRTFKEFGAIDILINSISLSNNENIKSTTVKKYDLLADNNSRATYSLSRLCIPHMLEKGAGHIITYSPPFTLNYIQSVLDRKILMNRIVDMTTKLSMSTITIGIAQELKNSGISANTIWPSKPIESSISENCKLSINTWYKDEIIVDSVLEMLKESPFTFTEKCLLDEEYLRTKGYNNFTKYREDKSINPPEFLDLKLNPFTKNTSHIFLL